MFENQRVFDLMLDDAVKQKFLDTKRNALKMKQTYFDELEAYIESEQCNRDIIRLKNGDYYFDAPVLRYVKKSDSSKKRATYLFYGNERNLLKYMTFVLHGFEDVFPNSLLSFRLHNRIKQTFCKIGELDPDRKMYVLKADIKGYGSSINQDILLDVLKPYFSEDPEFYAFLVWFFKRNQYYYKYKIYDKEFSLVDGVPLGSFATNMYLLELDYILEKKAEFYMRYTDDIAIACKTKEEVLACYEILKEFTTKRKLELNDDKTEILEPGQDFEIMGIKIMAHKFDISHVSIGKIKRKFKVRKHRLLNDIRRGIITKEEGLDKMIAFSNRYFFDKEFVNELNWVEWAFPIINVTDGIKDIDHYIQDCIRSVGSGKNNNAKYRITYDYMKQRGYRSLVREFYHRKEEKTDRFRRNALEKELSEV